jgi:hypothetical protein
LEDAGQIDGAVHASAKRLGKVDSFQEPCPAIIMLHDVSDGKMTAGRFGFRLRLFSHCPAV